MNGALYTKQTARRAAFPRQDYASNRPGYAGLVALIALDDTLAQACLSLANSPFYGLDGLIDSLEEACMLIGRHGLRQLIYSHGAGVRFGHKAA